MHEVQYVRRNKRVQLMTRDRATYQALFGGQGGAAVQFHLDSGGSPAPETRSGARPTAWFGFLPPGEPRLVVRRNKGRVRPP